MQALLERCSKTFVRERARSVTSQGLLTQALNCLQSQVFAPHLVLPRTAM